MIGCNSSTDYYRGEFGKALRENLVFELNDQKKSVKFWRGNSTFYR